MFEKLVIQNFQAQRSITLELDPHVTCIIGESDVGKSSVLRALYWLCMNRPSGNEFRTWGSSKTRVTLHVDGRRVTRIRGKRNLYKLDGTTLEAFSHQIPDEVAKVLRVDGYNFQMQLDMPFWFALSPGQVSKELNRVVNLEVIDSCLTKAAQEIRTSKTRMDVIEERLETARRDLLDLDWVEEADRMWSRVESLEDKTERKRSLLASLTTVLGRLAELRVARDKAAAKRSRVEAASRYYERKVVGLEEQAEEAQARLTILTRIIRSLKSREVQKCQARKQIKALLKQIEQEKENAKTCPACGQTLPSSVATSTSR